MHGIDLSTGDLLFSTPDEEQQQGYWSVEAIEFCELTEQFRVATGNSEVITFDSRTGTELDRVSVDFRTPAQKAVNQPKWSQLWEGDFNHDATTLISSSAEFLYVWDAATGDQDAKHQMPHAKGCYLRVSPNGGVIATSDLQYHGDYGEDVIRLIAPESGKVLKTIPCTDARANVLTFSPDGKRLFTGMTRGSAIVWDVDGAQ